MSPIKEVVVFELLNINPGADASGTPPVEIMPRLILAGRDPKIYKWMTFLRTRLFEGNIQVDGERFKARLGNDYAITLGLDSPGAALVLSPERKPAERAFDWWGADRLTAAHKIHGRFFTFAATPAGDQLTVRPYEGELGTFAVGPGKRALTNLSVSGSFGAEKRTVPVGGDFEEGRPEPVPTCQVPAGDYLPSLKHPSWPPADRGFTELPLRGQTPEPGRSSAGLWHCHSQGQAVRAGLLEPAGRDVYLPDQQPAN